MESVCLQCGWPGVRSLGWEFPWRRKRQPTPVLLPRKSHGRRSLVGCSPWGCEELDMTEWLHFYFSLSCIGEGNGNPLQCTCLENPRDRGAWWAAIYGVAQSWTRLKRLSSSSPSWFLVHQTGLYWDHGGDLWLRGPKGGFRWFAQTHSHCRADRAPVLCDPQLSVPLAPFSVPESRENTDVGCSPSQMAACLCDP